MKKWIVACAALMLVSCIDVDDYGSMWGHATIDPGLQGRWVKMSEEEDGKKTGQEYTFALKNGAYEIQGYVNGETDNDPIYPVKTLAVGSYRFLASGPDKGTMIRYVMEKNESMWLVLKPQKAWGFIESKYSDQDSLYREDPDDSASAQDNADRPIRIKIFDDTAVKILSSIPDTGDFWDPDTKLQKIQ